jgi:pimeloyl-ACP methyl ester carboxylesterase
MPFATADGIRTRYEVVGDGPPLLMFSPGGFNATVENWSEFGIYQRLGLLEHVSARHTCIAFDKRESGRSGGRIEPLTWRDYAAQGAGLLDHLGIERAHLLGGCIGCSIALAFAIEWPERVESLVLYSPAGGPRYRLMQQRRFAEHLAYVEAHGLDAVVELAASTDKTFAQDPRVGPWVNVLRAEPIDVEERHYAEITAATAEQLFDRDTIPGAAPEPLIELALTALVVPGNDPNHALSAAHYLHECLPHSELWHVLPDDQTAANAPARVLDFLQSSDSPRSSAAI